MRGSVTLQANVDVPRDSRWIDSKLRGWITAEGEGGLYSRQEPVSCELRAEIIHGRVSKWLAPEAAVWVYDKDGRYLGSAYMRAVDSFLVSHATPPGKRVTLSASGRMEGLFYYSD